MISHRYRCVFVHAPRTGGSTVEDLIWPPPRSEEELYGGFVDRFHNRHQTGGLQHLTARQIRADVGDDVFSSYLRFTVVRNPWDRTVSQYAYMARRPDLREFLGMPEGADFATYLRLLDLREHVQWTPQSAFVTDDDGTLLVDRVLRLERLAEELPPLLEELGVPFDDVLPRRNVSVRRPDHRSYYDDETHDLVAERYREDVERFGYAV